MRRRNRPVVTRTLVLALLLGLACSPEPGPEHEAAVAEEEHADAVVLSEAELREFGIEISTAGPGRIATTIELPGEIRPNQDRLAHIVPRFPGIAKSVNRAVGDRVERGDTLAQVESSESLATYAVRSLLEGVVIARHVSVGESVSSDREIFVVADLSTVWIDFQAFQKHLPLLAAGQRVHVFAGHGLPEAEALVSYIAPVVDEATRTATVRVVLENPEGRWRPGLFVTGRIETAESEASIVVPTTAIQTLGELPVVFVQEEDAFEPRHVRIGRSGPHFVEVSAGLAAGERFVSSGGFTLKAELQRGRLGDGHAH